VGRTHSKLPKRPSACAGGQTDCPSRYRRWSGRPNGSTPLEADPDQIIVRLAPRQGGVSYRALVVNAIMAGCQPEYLPMIAAALRAIARPEFLLWTVQTTTNPVTPMLVCNGPRAREIGVNAKYGAFGPGWRANLAIGRCLRLLMTNVGGGVPGGLDRATHGQAGKLFFCVAEDEEGSPWGAYHVARGFDPDANTVTVFAAG